MLFKQINHRVFKIMHLTHLPVNVKKKNSCGYVILYLSFILLAKGLQTEQIIIGTCSTVYACISLYLFFWWYALFISKWPRIFQEIRCHFQKFTTMLQITDFPRSIWGDIHRIQAYIIMRHSGLKLDKMPHQFILISFY